MGKCKAQYFFQLSFIDVVSTFFPFHGNCGCASESSVHNQPNSPWVSHTIYQYCLDLCIMWHLQQCVVCLEQPEWQHILETPPVVRGSLRHWGDDPGVDGCLLSMCCWLRYRYRVAHYYLFVCFVNCANSHSEINVTCRKCCITHVLSMQSAQQPV